MKSIGKNVLVITGVIVAIVACSFSLTAQELRSTLRGKIVDIDRKIPVIGANVIIVDSDPILGSSTDPDGEFRIDKVPLGRLSLEITCMGYEPLYVSNLIITSAKETVLELEMQEAVTSMEELVITAGGGEEVLNDMALTSVRSFSVEETSRYAGSFMDPARMISGFAGVTSNAEGSNEIVVRGNSPTGIQWRLEGIEIPNPNHFADEGSTGGPINALNSAMLANSEFYSGAFTPEYGNAFSGVFDMRLRNGNNEKHERAVSVGVLGTDVTLEGPFSKSSRASYLVNYRYSTLSLLDQMGLVDFGGVPKYQDLSFKVNVPTSGFGTFTLFGLGGKSKISEDEVDEFKEDSVVAKGNYKAGMGVVGLNHMVNLSSNSYIVNSFSYSENNSGADFTWRNHDNGEFTKGYYDDFTKSTLKWSVNMHNTLSSRSKIQSGFTYTSNDFKFFGEETDTEGPNDVNQDHSGTAGLMQGFISYKYRAGDNITMVGGLHALGTTLNDNWSIEPRASVQWQINPGSKLSFGYGLHGKMESLPNYYAIEESDNDVVVMPNKNLDFSKAHHFVMGYDQQINDVTRLKTEIYYQQLYNMPIENAEGSTYALLNEVEGYTRKSLVNEGKGTNYGLEFTVERFFHHGFYYMVTTSLYDSKYTPKDGKEYNSRFNGNYVGNVLIGKEFNVGKKGNKTISINARATLMGARRYTPIDLEASIEAGETVRYDDRPFSEKGDDVFFANLALSYRWNKPRVSQELKLDIQNFTNNEAVIDQYYNDLTRKIETSKQLPLLPVFMYTLYF